MIKNYAFMFGVLYFFNISGMQPQPNGNEATNTSGKSVSRFAQLQQKGTVRTGKEVLKPADVLSANQRVAAMAENTDHKLLMRIDASVDQISAAVNTLNNESRANHDSLMQAATELGGKLTTLVNRKAPKAIDELSVMVKSEVRPQLTEVKSQLAEVKFQFTEFKTQLTQQFGYMNNLLESLLRASSVSSSSSMVGFGVPATAAAEVNGSPVILTSSVVSSLDDESDNAAPAKKRSCRANAPETNVVETKKEQPKASAKAANTKIQPEVSSTTSQRGGGSGNRGGRGRRGRGRGHGGK